MTTTFAFISAPYPPKDGFVQWRICLSRGNKRNSRTGLLQNNDVQRPFTAKHIDTHISLVVSGKQEIRASLCYLQSSDCHLLEEPRQDRLRERQALFRSRYAQTQASFE